MSNAPTIRPAGDEIDISFTLNGETIDVSVTAHHVLADLLRDHFRLTGLNISCASGVCGSCTVLVDGAPVSACAQFAYSIHGKDVVTIEGLDRDGKLSPVQAAFSEHSAFQCGYCTPGMILLATALLAENPHPSREEIRAWMNANICRCTGYEMIIEAVEQAAAGEVGADDR